jgi:Flp pilus assembly pilin Flp
MKGVVNVKRTNSMNVVKRIKGSLTRFLKEEDGVGVVEVVLILVVLIGLIVIFKSKLTVLLNSIFSTITQRTGSL